MTRHDVTYRATLTITVGVEASDAADADAQARPIAESYALRAADADLIPAVVLVDVDEVTP